jgi:hypothetical protein
MKDKVGPAQFNLTNCGSLQIRKTDSSTPPINNLADAKFKVYKDNVPLEVFENNDTLISTGTNPSVTECTTTTTDGIGNCIYTNLPIGDFYWVEETQAPQGYVLDTTRRRVAITGTSRITSTWVNSPALGDLKIVKNDDANNLMNGVQFTLSGTSTTGLQVGPVSCTTGATNSSGTDTPAAGECSFLNIPLGTNYTLAEGMVPSGYAADPSFPRTGVSVTSTLTTVNVTNPRTHKVVVVVCHEGTNTLAASQVTLGESQLTTVSTAPAGTTEAALCGMAGLSGLGHGNQSPTVNVGSAAHGP